MLNKARPVDVISLQQLPLAPVVTGFGRVKPKVEWQAIAEVSGKVVYRHPGLEKGRVLDAGTTLLKIDPLDYELRLAQAEADVSSSQAQLAKLAQEEQNLKTTLKIEKKPFGNQQERADPQERAAPQRANVAVCCRFGTAKYPRQPESGSGYRESADCIAE